jgi:predicted RecB family nuclease
MRLVASDFYLLHNPSFCELRVYLDQQPIPKPPPSPFQQLLFELGKRHERNHLATLGAYVDLSQGSERERERATREAVERKAGVIYQPVLRVQHAIAGVSCEVLGEPDFLVARRAGYIVRDAKLARRVNKRDHPEILLQMGLYGWLFEGAFGTPPVGLEVVDGLGGIVSLPYDGGAGALHVLGQVIALRTVGNELYSPVGWTKCQGCAYWERCWRLAQNAQDPALVQGVDQGLACALRSNGIESIGQFVERFDMKMLAAFSRPSGRRTKKVGRAAPEILRNARVLASGREELFARPIIPESANYVIFDLEGLPPYLDELDRIYLWGMQVFGESPSDYLGVLAETGEDADRDTWQRFLTAAKGVFDRYGDLPFVHWHHYEKTKLDQYVTRYGDPNGVAARVASNMLDLHGVARRSIALPLPSFSLKVVEKYIGFERTQKEFGGEWSMAKFIEAVETGDEVKRSELLEEIRKYNEEDLAATWAVLQWLKKKAHG